MSDRRKAVLDRVAEALGSSGADHATQRAADEARRGIAAAMPPAPESFDDRIALFAELSQMLQTEFIVVETADEARSVVEAITKRETAQRVAGNRHPLVRQVCADITVEWIEDGFDKDSLAGVDIGITSCDALIAQTGSVLLTSRRGGGRVLSVLPPHHVVVATRDQMLGGLPDAFTLLEERYRNDWPSMITFITGPSRTSDIERTLVLGAHGPKELTVILIARA